MSLLDAALAAAGRGVAVFPVKPDKSPYVKGGFKAATADPEKIRAWWQRWPDAGIATPTGEVFVLDVDEPAALDKLVAEHGQLPPTVEAATPRGRHFYLKGQGVTNRRGQLPDGIDARGKGGYVVMPPSPGYEWRTAPDEAPIAPAPAWLLELLNGDKRRNGSGAAVEGEIAARQRNSALTSLGGVMRRAGFHEAAIAAALLETNRERCKPPLEDREVRSIAHSMIRYKPNPEAAASLEELSGLLGLTAVGKRLDRVQCVGRGTKAGVYLHLDDGSQVVLYPLGHAAAGPQKLALELVSQAGARPELKAADVLRAVQMIFQLGDHFESVDIADRARDLAAEYLSTAVLGECRMSDQADRWRAFEALDKSCRTGHRKDVVLGDRASGDRYVRAQWIHDYLRGRTGPGEPDRMMHELERTGWRKPGKEGRVKATRPGFKDELVWAFYVVPAEWERQ